MKIRFKSELLRERRKLLGMTIQTLIAAAKTKYGISLSVGSVSQWESGQNVPNAVYLYLLSRILDVELKDLFEEVSDNQDAVYNPVKGINNDSDGNVKG